MVVDLKKKKKAGSRWYLAETITDKVYKDDPVLHLNIPAQATSLRHSLEQAAGGIAVYVNANKAELMCFTLGVIFILYGKPLKLVNKFKYLSSNISSTEGDVSIHLAKA